MALRIMALKSANERSSWNIQITSTSIVGGQVEHQSVLLQIELRDNVDFRGDRVFTFRVFDVLVHGVDFDWIWVRRGVCCTTGEVEDNRVERKCRFDRARVQRGFYVVHRDLLESYV